MDEVPYYLKHTPTHTCPTCSRAKTGRSSAYGWWRGGGTSIVCSHIFTMRDTRGGTRDPYPSNCHSPRTSHYTIISTLPPPTQGPRHTQASPGQRMHMQACRHEGFEKCFISMLCIIAQGQGESPGSLSAASRKRQDTVSRQGTLACR